LPYLQTISEPQGEKRKFFAKSQEAARKDVERAFGVLQARFAIVSLPCRLWATPTMKVIMKAVIILHNMIIEDERDLFWISSMRECQFQIAVQLQQGEPRMLKESWKDS